jgi:drug/metabolite transporter (DMT)-like permease
VVWGAVGVLVFSFSLPATRLAVKDLDPTVVGLGRAVVAAVLAGLVLLAWRAPLPARRDLPRFAIVGSGVVIGFPLFTSLALRDVPSAHATIAVGLAPAATAVAAVARAGERPPAAFWAAAGVGLTAVMAFAVTQGVHGVGAADLYVLIGIACVAVGYAEGGALAREYGGPQVICWALLLMAPLLIPVVAVRTAQTGLQAGADAWLGFAYVAVFSMFLGFFAWYRGLAMGGVARVGQVQLAQPVLTLVWAALILGESVSTATAIAAVVVLVSVVGTQRTRAAVPSPPDAGPVLAVNDAARLDPGRVRRLPGAPVAEGAAGRGAGD